MSEKDVVRTIQPSIQAPIPHSSGHSSVQVPFPVRSVLESQKSRKESSRDLSSDSMRHTNSWEKLTFSSRPPDVQPAWAGRAVKILSASADQAQAPCISEGVNLLPTPADVSKWDTAIARRWNPDAQLLFNISQGKFDMVWITLPTQGMSRTHFANANGPSPQRSRRHPCGFPWLPEQGKRATDSVTINAAALLVLAFAAMTQKNTALVLTTSEERGEGHFGEPCSWWQTAEVKHLAKLGANRHSTHASWPTSGLKATLTSQVPEGSRLTSRAQKQ